MSDTSLSDILTAYGEALYLAQSMEMGMRIFYCLDKDLPKAPPGKDPRVDFDTEPLPDLTTNSLGGFLRQFRREMLEEGAVDVSTRNIMRQLEQSAEYRNWLVHSCWWEWLPDLATEAGRTTILAELRKLVAQFHQHNLMIREMVLLCIKTYGFEPEQIHSPRFHEYLRRFGAQLHP